MWSVPTTADVPIPVVHGWLTSTLAGPRLSRFPVPFPLLFLDLETTRDRAVEIAMVRFQRGFAPWVFHTTIDPGTTGWGRSKRYWNTEVHGVTGAMVQSAPTFAALAPTLRDALRDATVVAHNVSFERRFLHQELRLLGSKFASPTLCTLHLARRLLPDLEDHKLNTLAAALDVRNPAPHRALGDTMTTLWVLLALLERHADYDAVARHLRAASRDAQGRELNPWQV